MTPEERAAWYASLPKKPPWPLLDQARLDHYHGVILKALHDAGINVESINDLLRTKEPYPQAVPVLLRLATEMGMSCREERSMRDAVIRALAVREARGIGADVLLPMFREIAQRDPDFGWVIANTLTMVADGEHFDQIRSLIHDERYGNARVPLPEALRGVDRATLIKTLKPLLGLTVPYTWSALDAVKNHRLFELREHIRRAYEACRGELRQKVKATLKVLHTAARKCADK